MMSYYSIVERSKPSLVPEFVLKVHNNDKYEFEKILVEYLGASWLYNEDDCVEDVRVKGSTFYTFTNVDSFTLASIISEKVKRCDIKEQILVS